MFKEFMALVRYALTLILAGIPIPEVFRNVKAQLGGGIAAIFITACVVAVASVIGLAITANSKKVFDDMALAAAANTAMSNTVSTIYTSWPLSGLIVLSLFGGAALMAFMYFRAR